MKQDFILQLADKAFYAGDISADGLHAASDEFCINFAKLIIEECISACATDKLGMTASAEDLIRAHFDK